MLFKSVRSTKQINSLYGTKQNHTAPKNDDSIAHCHCQDYKRMMIFNEKKAEWKRCDKKSACIMEWQKKRGHLDLVLGSIIAECAYTFSYAKSSVCMWFVYMFYFLCDFRFLSLFLIGSSSSSLYRICERLPFKAAFQVTFVSCVSWAQTRDLAAFQL